jgi:hypothetical protein
MQLIEHLVDQVPLIHGNIIMMLQKLERVAWWRAGYFIIWLTWHYTVSTVLVLK